MRYNCPPKSMKKSFLLLLTLVTLQINAKDMTVSDENASQFSQETSSAAADKNSKHVKNQKAQVTRTGNVYFYKDQAMSGKEYAEFLRVNCPAAYVKYHQGEVMTDTGWIVGGAGLALSVGALIGGMTMLDNAAIQGCIYGGAGLMVVGIPVLTIGYVKKHKSVDVFNASCSSKNIAQSYWTVNTSQDGIGLALHF